MRASQFLLVGLMILGVCEAPAVADPINVFLGGDSISFVHATGGGQNGPFPNLWPFTSDFSANTPLAMSGGFHFNTVSSGIGYYTPLSRNTFQMSNASSGILTGSISSIQIIGATSGSTQASITEDLNLSNMNSKQCTTRDCTNNDTLGHFATACTGVEEMIAPGEHGFLVPNRDPEALATKIADLLADPGNRMRINHAGYLRVATQFPHSRMIAGYEQLYKECISMRSSPVAGLQEARP